MNLSKIYDLLIQNKKIEKPQPPVYKKPVNLTEAYSIIREKADILIHHNPPHGKAQEFSIDSELAKKIEQQIKAEEHDVTINGQIIKLRQFVELVLEEKNWYSGAEKDDYLNNTLKIFSTTNINTTTAQQYLDSFKKTSPLEQKLAVSGSENLYNLISPEFKALCIDSNQAKEIFDTLFLIKLSKATISVGKGELAISLASNALKGKTGDLSFSTAGEVEIKATDINDHARLGGDGYTFANTGSKIEDILSKNNLNITSIALDNIKNNFISFIKNKIVSIPTQNELLNNINQITHLEDVKNSISSIPTVSRANSSTLGLTQKQKDMLIKRYEGLIEKMQKTSTGITLRKSLQIVSNSINRINYSDIINLLVQTKSYKGTNEQELKGSLEQIITPDNYRELSDFNNLSKLIASIHLVCYYDKEKFNGIMFINNSNKNFFYIKTQDKNISQLLKETYDILTNNNFSIRPDVDDKFKSFGIGYTG